MEMPSYSTRQVEQILGISRRKLDHLIRSGVLPPGGGQGSRRKWDEDTIKRLDVARKLEQYTPGLSHKGMSVWPVIVEDVMNAKPPKPGWVNYNHDPMTGGDIVTYLGYPFNDVVGPIMITHGVSVLWNGLEIGAAIAERNRRHSGAI